MVSLCSARGVAESPDDHEIKVGCDTIHTYIIIGAQSLGVSSAFTQALFKVEYVLVVHDASVHTYIYAFTLLFVSVRPISGILIVLLEQQRMVAWPVKPTAIDLTVPKETVTPSRARLPPTRSEIFALR